MTRTFIGLVVVALFAGCATDALDTSEAVQDVKQRCPDPTDCTVNNGGGVYTEELGKAGFSDDKFMIMGFVNSVDANGAPNGVSVVGRFFNSYTGTWQIKLTTIDHALINNEPLQPFQVVSVAENLTAPSFLIGGHIVTDLTTLELVMREADGLETLSFGPQQSDTGNGGSQSVVLSYPMYWNAGTTRTDARQDYCFRAVQDGQTSAVPDPVVFQQGISVNPITAQMDRDSTVVTLSCRHGAIANARSWGYTYRGDADKSLMFEAAMHMKRASYCGDETFYTRRDTPIAIKDIAGIQHDNVNSSNVEARWGRASGGRIRALCVNYVDPDLRRHPAARYPLSGGVLFDGRCFDNSGQVAFSIPTCTTFDAAGGTGVVISDANAP